mgnify:CR=1 FL=1
MAGMFFVAGIDDMLAINRTEEKNVRIEMGNMKKRYQIFVSSTYKDLIEERLIVKKAILEMKHFPAGMEEFPALDKPQWNI